MKRLAAAFACAVAVHAVLAACIAALLAWCEPEVVGPELDLSSVELSLAEKESADSPPVVSLPASPSAESAPPPPQEPPPPEALPPPDPEAAPPDVDAPTLPDPEPEAPPRMDLPEPKAEIVKDAPAKEEPDERDRPEREPAAEPSPPVEAPQQARVDVPPSPRRTIRPKYPRESRIRGEEGDVLLEFEVDASGAVAGVRVARSSGFPALDAAAVEAVRDARFTPAKSGRRAVASSARITLEFKLK